MAGRPLRRLRTQNPDNADLAEWAVLGILESEGPLRVSEIVYYSALLTRLDVLTALQRLVRAGRVVQDGERFSVRQTNPRKKQKKLSETQRSTVAMAHSLRGGAGAGTHHTRQRDVATGRSRKPKHGGKRALVEARENPSRRNPLDVRWKENSDIKYLSVRVPESEATLDLDVRRATSHPRTISILPSSRGHRGVLVRMITGLPLTADDLMDEADRASEFARTTSDFAEADYYEGLAKVFTEFSNGLRGRG